MSIIARRIRGPNESNSSVSTALCAAVTTARWKARSASTYQSSGDFSDASWTTLSQGERGRALIAREQLLETLDHVHTTHPHLASVLVTHHLEELPASTTHAALLREGKVLASGPAYDVLTTNLISKTFNHPIRIQYAAGRWTATARPAQPVPAAR